MKTLEIIKISQKIVATTLCVAWVLFLSFSGCAKKNYEPPEEPDNAQYFNVQYVRTNRCYGEGAKFQIITVISSKDMDEAFQK